ncbi:MAG: hypothetical protein E6J91_33945 [Deltaproteobacteria bacterium]|nr:MAG: hypothetical protein E6J91_33945 [Deltaproteobacteria bacterium]
MKHLAAVVAVVASGVSAHASEYTFFVGPGAQAVSLGGAGEVQSTVVGPNLKPQCALHGAGNAECINATMSKRPAPASCPPGYNDDGATCRLNNILAKESFGRGVGTTPTVCGAGRELDAGLCYPICQSGYHGVGPVCWQGCPNGFRDDGAYCAKPRGRLSVAVRRCAVRSGWRTPALRA